MVVLATRRGRGGPQANSGRVDRPALTGADLVADHFHDGSIEVLGFRRDLTPKACDYAIYLCR